MATKKTTQPKYMYVGKPIIGSQILSKGMGKARQVTVKYTQPGN